MNQKTLFETPHERRDPPAHYNTTHESAADALERERHATDQELAILAQFSDATNLTPWEVLDRLSQPMPITSVRRAITNLTERGKLERTDTKRRGPYGRNSYAWRKVEHGRA